MRSNAGARLGRSLLAMLVGCHRPTVTIALQRLAREGILVRRAHNVWLLKSTALEYLREPDRLSELSARFDECAGERALGPGLG